VPAPEIVDEVVPAVALVDMVAVPVGSGGLARKICGGLTATSALIRRA
jgi:threonine dehydratase